VPPCPYTGEPDFAVSAGCLVHVHGRVLVVVSSWGGVTPPGGKAREGESAQCAAHRETWEETGLDLRPGRLIHVFDTGFHLYDCEIHAGSGAVELGPKREVRGWRWLSIDDFDQVEWRYPGQGEALYRLLMEGE
jgi:8-oxo-dGTP pyrophosphatase MutT (NUDIX family)